MVAETGQVGATLTAVSLFAGIEGFGLAFRRAGIHVVAAVEIDPACRGVIARHFPEVQLFSDIREVTGDQLRAAGFDPARGVVAGGWPCTGNSVAGRREGMADPRSGLWVQFARLLGELAPAWFVGENVPGLYTVNGGADIAVVRGDLAQRGYWWAERILDAQYFGVPQRRQRVFFVGCFGDRRAPVEVLFEPEGGGGDLAAGGAAGAGAAGGAGGGADGTRVHAFDVYNQAVGDVAYTLDSQAARHNGQAVATLQGGGRRGHRIDAEGAAGGHLIAVPVALRGREGGSQIEAGEPGEPAFTVRTPGGGSSHPMVAHALTSEGADASEDGTGRSTPLVAVAFATSSLDCPRDDGLAPPVKANRNGQDTGSGASVMAAVGSAVRRLTPRECERLQGFPDDWTRYLADGSEQSDSARYRQLGNAVAVPVAEWVARRIVEVAR